MSLNQYQLYLEIDIYEKTKLLMHHFQTRFGRNRLDWDNPYGPQSDVAVSIAFYYPKNSFALIH